MMLSTVRDALSPRQWGVAPVITKLKKYFVDPFQQSSDLHARVAKLSAEIRAWESEERRIWFWDIRLLAYKIEKVIRPLIDLEKKDLQLLPNNVAPLCYQLKRGTVFIAELWKRYHPEIKNFINNHAPYTHPPERLPLPARTLNPGLPLDRESVFEFGDSHAFKVKYRHEEDNGFEVFDLVDHPGFRLYKLEKLPDGSPIRDIIMSNRALYFFKFENCENVEHSEFWQPDLCVARIIAIRELSLDRLGLFSNAPILASGSGFWLIRKVVSYLPWTQENLIRHRETIIKDIQRHFEVEREFGVNVLGDVQDWRPLNNRLFIGDVQNRRPLNKRLFIGDGHLMLRGQYNVLDFCKENLEERHRNLEQEWRNVLPHDIAEACFPSGWATLYGEVVRKWDQRRAWLGLMEKKRFVDFVDHVNIGNWMHLVDQALPLMTNETELRMLHFIEETIHNKELCALLLHLFLRAEDHTPISIEELIQRAKTVCMDVPHKERPIDGTFEEQFEKQQQSLAHLRSGCYRYLWNQLVASDSPPLVEEQDIYQMATQLIHSIALLLDNDSLIQPKQRRLLISDSDPYKNQTDFLWMAFGNDFLEEIQELIENPLPKDGDWRDAVRGLSSMIFHESDSNLDISDTQLILRVQLAESLLKVDAFVDFPDDFGFRHLSPFKDK